MKYLPILLIFLSCTAPKSDKGLNKSGQLYTKMWHHSTGPKYKFKGPVKEVTQTVWQVMGGAVEYDSNTFDSLTTMSDAKRLGFNRDGYLTEETSGGRFAVKPGSRGMNTTLYHYNDNKQICKIEFFYSSYKAALKGEQNTLRVPAVVSHYSFSGDTLINRTVYLGEETVQRSRVTGNKDSILFYGCSPDAPLPTDTTKYKKGEDGMFRWSETWSDTYTQQLKYTFRSGTLESKKELYHDSDSNMFVTEYYYNEHGDITHSKQLEGPEGKSPYHLYEHSYTYDKHNNWIKNRVTLGSMIIREERREITYWE